MPSIAPRPLHLLDASSRTDSNDSDSEVSESSTVSCYPASKPNSPCSEKGETITTSPRSDTCCSNHKKSKSINNDASSISSTDSSDSESIQSNPASDVACAVPKPEEEREEEDNHKANKSVGFEALSTLFVFDDDLASGKQEKNYYDVAKTWYSNHELRAFRADAFLTVNWMITNNMGGQNEELLDISSESNHSHNSHFSKSDRQTKVCSLIPNYEFCERGLECRTPLGRCKKNKRRVDAIRAVFLYQHMQRQHRKQVKREERRKHMLQYSQQDKPTGILRRHTLNLESDVEDLANVYSSYCKDCAAEALERGQSDAIEAGMSSACSSRTECVEETKSTKHIVTKSDPLLQCPSLCHDDSEDDAFMDRIVSLTFEDADDEYSENDSVDSEPSLSLDALAGNDFFQDQNEEEGEVSGVIEVELIQDDDKQHSHRITCEEQFAANLRLSSASCTSLPHAQVKVDQLEHRPTSVSFSSLEDLFGAVANSWW